MAQRPSVVCLLVVGQKPSRIEGLWMVMPLALLVYSVAQRRMRRRLTRHHETVPNPSPTPTSPT